MKERKGNERKGNHSKSSGFHNLVIFFKQTILEKQLLTLTTAEKAPQILWTRS